MAMVVSNKFLRIIILTVLHVRMINALVNELGLVYSLRNKGTSFRRLGFQTNSVLTSKFGPYIGLAREKYTEDRVSFRYSSSIRSTNSNSDGSFEKARLLFLGTPDVAASSLRALCEESMNNPECKYEVVGVVTQPAKRRKRRGKVEASPVGVTAEEFGIPSLTPEKAKDGDFLTQLENDLKPDICITAAYGQYLPKRFLAIPKFGTLNIHPSLLPRWRGASPVQRSLEAGDNPVGVSVLFTVSKMDAGPIVKQSVKEISDEDQATEVLPLLFDIGTKDLIEALPKVISGEITFDTADKQDDDMAVAASMIDSSEGELKPWLMTASECHNRVRGFSMWPGTFMYFSLSNDPETNVKVKIVKTKIAGGPGSVPKDERNKSVGLCPTKKSGLMITCSDGSVLELMQVQPVTKKVMDARSFKNGLQGQTVEWVEMPSEEE